MYDNGYYITVFFTVLGAFVTLIFPVYLLIRVIKASRKEDDEQEVMLVGEIEMPSIDEPS
jgi:predicted membrane protein